MRETANKRDEDPQGDKITRRNEEGVCDNRSPLLEGDALEWFCFSNIFGLF